MSRGKTVRQYHHGNLKAALKKAALQLVGKRGPKGFSLNEASRLAGVDVAAPYRHFDDKEGLLAEIACDGNAVLLQEVEAAAGKPREIRDQMFEAGMAYLRFSVNHSAYFDVIFNSGIDKMRHPEVQLSGARAFNVIKALSQRFESTKEQAELRAITAWALIHGLATLCADGALSPERDFEQLQPVLRQFLKEPFG